MSLPNHIKAALIGGFFAFFAISISFYEIYKHVQFNHNKYIRRYIIRILLMVPVYAIESWFGILYPSSSVYLNALRDIYEAITIFSFYQLLVNTLGGFRSVSLSLQQSNTSQEFPHMFPFKYCCKSWKFIQIDLNLPIANDNLKEEFLSPQLRKTSSIFHYKNPRSNPFFRNCTIGVLQFCFVECICTIIIFILQFIDLYGDGKWDFTNGYPYFVVILSLSQSWAIYCLVLFYYSIKNIHNENDCVYLQFIQMKPISKFLCIKGVVFFTYWQSIGIALLVFMNIIHDDMMNSVWTADNIANSLQDFIICIEMFCFAIVHHYAFNPNHFYIINTENKNQNKNNNYKSAVQAVIDAVNVTDIAINANDVVDLKNSETIKSALNTIGIDNKININNSLNECELTKVNKNRE